MPVPRMFYSQLANDGLNCRKWMVGAVETWGTTHPSLKFSRQLAGKVRPKIGRNIGTTSRKLPQ